MEFLHNHNPRLPTNSQVTLIPHLRMGIKVNDSECDILVKVWYGATVTV
jgi:hypothetical protein